MPRSPTACCVSPAACGRSAPRPRGQNHFLFFHVPAQPRTISSFFGTFLIQLRSTDAPPKRGSELRSRLRTEPFVFPVDKGTSLSTSDHYANGLICSGQESAARPRACDKCPRVTDPERSQDPWVSVRVANRNDSRPISRRGFPFPSPRTTGSGFAFNGEDGTAPLPPPESQEQFIVIQPRPSLPCAFPLPLS